jgi:methylated-DNA-[protein]-cysteine S-methyltransferase
MQHDGIAHRDIETPVGVLRLEVAVGHVVCIRFCGKTAPQAPSSARTVERETLDRASNQLHEYFAGQRRTFDLPMVPRGTAFQLACWKALGDIAFGDVISYGEQARRIGRPRALRAVGQANNANPLPIVVPCHRVIGASGTLTGYGGGLEVKRWLLQHEGVLPRELY